MITRISSSKVVRTRKPSRQTGRPYKDRFQQKSKSSRTKKTWMQIITTFYTVRICICFLIQFPSYFSKNSEFKDDKQSFSCTVYYAQGFYELRQRCQVNADFAASLERCVPWNAVGGKSGADFFKSHGKDFRCQSFIESILTF
jgi:hypothetical protein